MKPLRNVNRTIPFVLLSLAVLNMAQARVLCVGGDGHIAIEPAGHEHFAESSRTFGCASIGLHLNGHSHVDHQHARPCTDIPMPVGAGDERITSRESEFAPTDITAPDYAPLTLDMPDLTEAAFFRILPSSVDPSRCIVLQV